MLTTVSSISVKELKIFFFFIKGAFLISINFQCSFNIILIKKTLQIP